MGWNEPEPLPLENIPVDQGFQLHQLMPHVDHFDQSGTQEIVLVRGGLSRLHVMVQNCKVPTETIPKLALMTKKVDPFVNKISGLMVVQDELIPLNTRLSSTRGLPCDFRKKGESLAICSSVSQ